nr:hypothetical protein JVH1_4183 [Rhodococcus sp. JVH1]
MTSTVEMAVEVTPHWATPHPPPRLHPGKPVCEPRIERCDIGIAVSAHSA